jgi:DNA anti-recombination protein RmuC
VNASSGRRRNFFNTAATVNAADSSNTTASTAAVASSAQHRRQQQQQQQQLSQTAPAAVTRSDRYASDRYYHSGSSTAAQLVKPAAMHDSAYDEQFSDAYGEEFSAPQQVLAQRGRACAHRLRTHYCTAALRGALRGWRHVAQLQRHCRYLQFAVAESFALCSLSHFK